MSGNRPIDSKREEFRKYLEKNGVLDALTKTLVLLYEEPEKPEDALEYVIRHLAENKLDLSEIESLKTENENLNLRIRSLEEEIALLQLKSPDNVNEEDVPEVEDQIKDHEGSVVDGPDTTTEDKA
uniref:c-Myc-binding protein n=1 Tax=Clastoptera arizonana TaxID=38151 RepID=A0A1B6BWP6_9HEMI